MLQKFSFLKSEGGMPKALQLCHFLTALFMMHIMKGLPDTRWWDNSRNADLCMGFSWLWAV